MKDAILELENITKIFFSRKKKIIACDNISFTVNDGEAVSLLGLNGAGKSTLINIISTQLVASSGTGRVCGFPLDKTLEIKKRLGVLHEKNPLYENMTAFQFLRFCQNMHGIDDEEFILELCEKWTLTDVKNSLIKTLSKGFKQRLGLVACLVHRPKLLILDEPSSGLDTLQQSEFEKNILELIPKLTLLLCTHDLEQAARLCKKHILLAKGKLASKGNIDEIAAELFSMGALDKEKKYTNKEILQKAFEINSKREA
ncbi:MAG: ABC transporter ATP-binding protein [Treponemataceae bacterium]